MATGKRGSDKLPWNFIYGIQIERIRTPRGKMNTISGKGVGWELSDRSQLCKYYKNKIRYRLIESSLNQHTRNDWYFA